MFCNHCGGRLQGDSLFCGSCGKPVAGAPAAPVARRAVQHVRLLAIFWIVFSALRLLGGGARIASARFIQGFGDRWLDGWMVGWPIREILPPMLAFSGAWTVLAAMAGLAAGAGLLERQSWARVLAMVLAFFALFSPPLGTALGIYTLWVLLGTKADGGFRGASRLAAFFLPALSMLWAQGEAVNARLTGAVMDAREAAIPGAKVTLSNRDTGFTRQFTTGDDGRYVFTQIPPGAYQLRVEKDAFATYVHPGIVLAVGQSSTLNPGLEVGAINQVVEVLSHAPLLNSGNANIGSEVSTKQVMELPLNLRNVFNLTLLNSSVNNAQEYQGLT